MRLARIVIGVDFGAAEETGRILRRARCPVLVMAHCAHGPPAHALAEMPTGAFV